MRPSEKREWEMIARADFVNGYAIHLKYNVIDNFGGQKILVFKGNWNPKQKTIDPTFHKENMNLIATFQPGLEGWAMAQDLADGLVGTGKPRLKVVDGGKQE